MLAEQVDPVWGLIQMAVGRASGQLAVSMFHQVSIRLPGFTKKKWCCLPNMPTSRGLANNGGASGGGININTSISVASDGTSNQKSDGGGSSQRQLADMINDQTKAVIAREMRQGGLIWNMRMGVA